MVCCCLCHVYFAGPGSTHILQDLARQLINRPVWAVPFCMLLGLLQRIDKLLLSLHLIITPKQIRCRLADL